MLFQNKINAQLYRNWFCKQFVNRSKELPQYTFFLKHVHKKDCIKTKFIKVSVYDILDNDGVNRLIKKLYKLKKKSSYKVSTYYLNHPFRKVNYISHNIVGRHTGLIAEVKFKDNNWLAGILISYTYANSSEMVIEYCFEFKKIMSTYVHIHDFIMDNILSVKKPPFFHAYADKSLISKADCSEIFKLDDIFFADILQAYICQMFYTQIGNTYKLPVEYDILTNKLTQNEKRKLRNAFLAECYERNGEFLIASNLNYDRFEVSYFRQGRCFPSAILLELFSLCSTEMRYKAFYTVELNSIELRMRKYLNSRRSFIHSDDIKWFVNKHRQIVEQDEVIKERLKSEEQVKLEFGNFIGWNVYYSGERKEKYDLINYPMYTQYFKTLYQQNLEYLNSIASVQNNKVVTIVTVATFIATILSIVISLLK